jgi:hypothetical protein
LAASCGLDVRTIQRIEGGHAASVTTRRCLARGLGYENPDIFDDPEFTLAVHHVLEGAQTINQEAIEKQHPEHIRVKTERVQNGETLGRFADAANAVLLNADDEIPHKAKQVAAELFDYIRDLLDVAGEASFSDKLSYNEDLEKMLRELEGLGSAAYAAFRSVKATGDNWVDTTPIAFRIGYLTVVPAQKRLTDMFVPRRVAMG